MLGAKGGEKISHIVGRSRCVGGLLQRKGNCYQNGCGCVFGSLSQFCFIFFKPLKSRTNVIFQPFLLVTGLYFCNNISIPQKYKANSNVTKDSKISFELVNPNVMVYRFSVPQTTGPILF